MNSQTTGNDNNSHSEAFDQSRVRGVWRYFYLLMAGWISFGAYFQVRGYYDAVIVSGIVITFLFSFYVCFKNVDPSNRTTAIWLVNTYIGIHCVGIFINAVNYVELVSSMLAIPIGMTIVYMLLGIRAASVWLAVSLLAFSAYPAIRFGVEASLPPSAIFDDTMLKTGACIVLFLCLVEFEGLFSRRAKDLFKLSLKLKEKTEELNSLATTDTLTGLPNRFQFNTVLDEQIKESLEHKEALALLMLDMDGFKQVNDTLGHFIGDEALCIIAERLREQLGEKIFVARLGGDEFCVLIRNPGDASELEALSRDIHGRLCEQYCLSNVNCQLGVSIGIALCPKDADATEELMTYADTAMYHAKENLQPFAFYETRQTERVLDYCALQDKLSGALNRNEFYLVYQPQFDVTTGQYIAAEALLRWNHNGDIVTPAEFIPHLENSGQIVPVTQWVLDTVGAQIQQWNEMGYQTKIAVNISAVDFSDPQFIDSVVAAVDKHRINSDQLELEITEGVFIDNLDEVASKFQRLKQLGITISLDDFGTGYSSLAYIRKLPLDKLKIDREFIRNIPDKDNGLIASTVIFLGKKLGLKVLAEGVETEDQLQFLKENDCEQYQGFLSSKPISAEQLLTYIRSSSKSDKVA